MDIEHRYQMFFFNLPSEISKIIGDLDNITVKRIKSKKNFVFDVHIKEKTGKGPRNYILKYFKTKNADNEFKTISHLKKQNVNVPSIISFEKPYLLLEKIDGGNFCDFINAPLKNTEGLSELNEDLQNQLIWGIKLLAQWFALLHKKNIVSQKEFETTIVLNKGDARLRDFLIKSESKSIFGVDFEEAYEGNHLDDLAWICCSLIDTDPGLFELDEPLHKMELINYFLKHYYNINSNFGFSFDYFADALIENLNLVIKRRGLLTGKLDKNNILDKLKREF